MRKPSKASRAGILAASLAMLSALTFVAPAWADDGYSAVPPEDTTTTVTPPPVARTGVDVSGMLGLTVAAGLCGTGILVVRGIKRHA